MVDYTNEYCPVEIIGPGLLSYRFVRVRIDSVVAYCLNMPAEYVVFANTLGYRADGQPDPLDVRELEVVLQEEMASGDDAVSVTLEVKA